MSGYHVHLQVKVPTGGVSKYFELEALREWRDQCYVNGWPFTNPYNPQQVLTDDILVVDSSAQKVIRERMLELLQLEFVEPRTGALGAVVAAATMMPVALPNAGPTPQVL